MGLDMSEDLPIQQNPDGTIQWEKLITDGIIFAVIGLGVKFAINEITEMEDDIDA